MTIAAPQIGKGRRENKAFEAIGSNCLMCALIDDGGNELTDPAYRRMPFEVVQEQGRAVYFNADQVVFPTLVEGSVLVSYVAIGMPGENPVIFGPLTVRKPVLAGDTLLFQPGDLNFSLEELRNGSSPATGRVPSPSDWKRALQRYA